MIVAVRCSSETTRYAAWTIAEFIASVPAGDLGAPFGCPGVPAAPVELTGPPRGDLRLQPLGLVLADDDHAVLESHLVEAREDDAVAGAVRHVANVELE